MKVITTNKKAYYNYFIEHAFEAGIVLKGSEVKSIRQGNCSIQDAYVSIAHDGQVYIKNMYVKNYEKTTSFRPEERQQRKLLLNKSEIKKLSGKVIEKGYTIVPLKVYFKKNLAKIEIALAKGKHTYDKRAVLAEKDSIRDEQRQVKTYLQNK